MESASRPISAVPWSRRSRSSKTSGLRAVVVLHLPQLAGLLVDDGLDAAGDVDEGALRGVAQGLLVVDDPDDGGQQTALRWGDVAPLGLRVDGFADHLRRGLSDPHQLQRGGQDFLAQAYELRVVGGDALFQVGGPARDLGAQLTDGAAAAYRFGRGGDDEERRDGSAPADGDPGRLRHQGDGGPGRRGHQYGRQQQHARVGKFTATGRRLNTHHVCPLRQIGWGWGVLC